MAWDTAWAKESEAVSEAVSVEAVSEAVWAKESDAVSEAVSVAAELVAAELVAVELVAVELVAVELVAAELVAVELVLLHRYDNHSSHLRNYLFPPHKRLCIHLEYQKSHI